MRIILLLALGSLLLVQIQSLASVKVSVSDSKDRQDVTIWTKEIEQELQAQDKPYLINYTAAWCITCQANDKVALSRSSVKKFFKENKKVLEPWLKKSRKNELWKGAVRKFEWQAGDRRKGDSMNTVLWSSRGSGIRTKRLDYIPTLVAISHIPVYGPESRTLSPIELLKLQSFPDNFKYDEKSIFKQVGNAVNVKMIKGCAQFLMFDQKLF